MIRRIGFFFGLLGWLATAAPLYAEDSVARQERLRDVYLNAVAALRANNITVYRKLAAELEGHVLHGQLEYEYLKNRVAVTPTEELRRYLLTNRHAYTTDRLRERWLEHLAAKQDWDTFLREYRSHIDNDKLYCLWLDRQLRNTEADHWALMLKVEGLWLTGQRLPSACNPVFAQWREAGHMSQDLVFARIKLAMERRQLSLARELAQYLPPSERVWVDRWVVMHQQPAQQLEQLRYPLDNAVARMIVRHGVVRVAWRDPAEAMRLWEQLKQKHRFFGEDENYVLHHVGVLGAQYHLPQAVGWLSAVSAASDDEALSQWRVRAALRAGDWELAKHFVSLLPQEAQQSDEWRYWKARILEESGERATAWDQYSSLSHERSYYGFMAADAIGRPYAMQHQSVDASQAEMNEMLGRPSVQLAGELFAAGDTVDARRQWHWMTRQMNKRELQVAAVVARGWGWHDRAILTVSASGHMDDLDLRFPVLYRDKVEQNAQRTGIDPGWIYGVMRQESAFVTDARSGAGALGLMQLMPRTGRATAERLKLNIRSRQAIMDVDNNLRLGSAFLRTVLQRHANNHILATAAYNAGSNRVNRWLPDAGTLPADVWVETIPYDETRNYVKNVMGYTAIYEHRLDVAPTRLSSRMAVVAPRP
jgi:soluble lytic murein transglycosylase